MKDEKENNSKNPKNPWENYEELRRVVHAASLFFGLGIYLATTVGVCIWLGMKFDAFFGTGQKGLLTGIFLGFPVAIFSLYKKMIEKR
jgi:F0F1-type ATP synthase assembly protein I